MTLEYVGGELEVFKEATCWKKYFSSFLKPYLHGSVLEVGCGMGANTAFMLYPEVTSWVCLEPDQALLNLAKKQIEDSRVSFVCATTDQLPKAGQYDTILYIDVLEHIKDDAGELLQVSQLLKPGGHIVVLSPAHQDLYSEFDKAIGHFRRYKKNDFSQINLSPLRLVRSYYLDSVGLLASLANRLLLKQSAPTLKQILFWDRVLVRASYVLDFLTFKMLGKSVIFIWEKNKTSP